jgi:hypothetical protein
MERTYKFKQAAIKQHIDIQTERKMFDLDLDTFGPYRVSYDRAGRYCPCLAGACHVVADGLAHAGFEAAQPMNGCRANPPGTSSWAGSAATWRCLIGRMGILGASCT